MLGGYGASFLDARGKLVARSYDILGGVEFFLAALDCKVPVYSMFQLVYAGLYSIFVFQKPDPDAIPPIVTPNLHDPDNAHEEVCFFCCLVASRRFLFSVSLEMLLV